MNKLWFVFIATILIIVVGIYVGTYSPLCPSTGLTKTIRMTIGSWYFDPDVVRVNCGDKVVMNIYNEDGFDHGLGLDLFGINRRIQALKTTTIEFTASQKGTFTYYCTVPCGDYNSVGKLGKTSVNSERTERTGHFDQNGKIVIS